jgi:alpha-1,3-glucosyltransferase
MLSEMFYLFALVYALKKGTKEKNNFSRLAVLFLQFGLMLLDDIHFQYNSFLQGLLILSVQMILDVSHLLTQEKYLMGAFLFSTLLNFKHIYLYAAPIYFIYLLGAYVKTDLGRLIKVAGVTLLPFAVAFLPLILAGGFEQVGYVMARLFPFERGLVHAYWAPNFWALYYFADRVIAALGFKQRNLA